MQRAEAALADLRKQIRESNPDQTHHLEEQAHELVMAQARLEVAKIRLQAAEDAANG